MLRRQAAQEAIDDPRLEGIGLAVTYELPDAVEDEPARGIALWQEIGLAEIFLERPNGPDRFFGKRAEHHCIFRRQSPEGQRPSRLVVQKAGSLRHVERAREQRPGARR